MNNYNQLIPPSPDELQARFHIPREYIRRMAAWMNLSESMVYSTYKTGRVPNQTLQLKLYDRCGIPIDTWKDQDLDERNRMLYTLWYNYETNRAFTQAME